MADGKKQIVIIDDYQGNRELYSKYLTMTGDYEVHTFPGHETANAWLAHNKADLIISDDDIKGQAYNGFQWTRELRDGGSLNAHTPLMICAVSDATLNEATAAGAQMLLSMPISMERFTEVVEVLLMPQSPLLPPVTVEPQKPVIAVVEDEPGIRRAYVRVLGDEYEVHSFEHPREAEQKLLNHRKVDLILSDDLMPHIHGTDWTRELRQSDSPNRTTPTIIASGTATAEEVQAAGAQASLGKPMNLDELRDTVKQWVGKEIAQEERVVIIEDEPAMMEWYKEVLETGNRKVYGFSNHEDAKVWLKSNKADVIITDDEILGQKYTGVEWLKEHHKADPDTPVIIISSSSVGAASMAAGAHEFLRKPATLKAIETAVGKALAANALKTSRSV